MEDDEILVEDWKMTKETIRHFGDVVMRIRLEGLPIATTIQAAAFATISTISNPKITIFNTEVTIFSMIMFASLLYLVPIFLLDIFYFHMLRKAVNHAREIEKMERFKDKLMLTTRLTSPKLTKAHRIIGHAIYLIVIVGGIVFGIFGSEIVASVITTSS